MVVGPRWGLDTKIDWPTDRRSEYNSLTHSLTDCSYLVGDSVSGVS
jgi:hypothetical protein